MFAYNYDRFTKEYLGSSECQESPLEPGVFLIPAFSTTIKPMDCPDGKAIVFKDEEWVLVDDFRDKDIYFKQNSLIIGKMSSVLEEPVPEGYSVIAPPDFEKKYVVEDDLWEEYQKTPEEIVKEYDDAMEKYLRDTRTARGYSLREPSDYKDSSVPRWSQDAVDWIAFRDAVLIYGLEVENTAQQTGVIPSMQEFLAGMPVITWTYQE